MLVLLGGAATSQAAAGSLRILYASNDLSSLDSGIVPAIAAEPGVATVDTFDTSTGTPTPAVLATYDLVVSNGDSSYNDPMSWGNELADYLDAGGAVIQFAYDNWDSSGASPTGRFASGGYAPFVPGPNANSSTTFGTVLAPSSPLLAGVTTLSTSDNTTDALAAGATLLAKWADGRNAIATKGRVESVTASLDSGGISPISTIAQLVVNAGNVLSRHALTVTKTGSGTGAVTSSPAGITCGSTCTFNYPYGASVTLTATPASGSTASLSGPGCSGGTTCTVTVNSATAITATFTLLRPSHTRIIKAKIDKKKHTASFTFTASGSVTGFQCALLPPKTKGHKRPKLRFRACTSPRIYRHLKHGGYKFEVRAVNSSGPDLKPAIKRFTI
jgi:hypothetical protein